MSSSALVATTKKRKKSDGRQQQQQINKCLNEKRRREQENIYIEELAELISASFADMSSLSVKPDKCAILQETVSQIRRIKQLEAQSGEAVQQGEVSSSKPALIGHQVFGPLLLEALEGFLFVVSSEGKVEFVTDTVSQFTRFTRDDILGKSIYNFLHHGDHARFSSGLLPMTLGWQDASRSRTFSCRLLIKPPDEQDETMEEKQQRVSKYETMQISSMLIPFPGGERASSPASEEAEGGPSMMCVARRVPSDNLANFTAQFTTKLDPNGVILSLDTSGITYGSCPGLGRDLVGKSMHQLVVANDAPRLATHLQETLSLVNPSTQVSQVYRLALNPNGLPLTVQTKSRMFKDNLTNEPDFIMATHTLINPDSEGGALGSPSSVGGPGSPMMAPTPGASLAPSSLDSPPLSRQMAQQQQQQPFAGFSSELGSLDFEFLTSTSGDWDLQAPPTAASTASGGSGSAWGSPPPPKPSPQQQQQQQSNWEGSSPSPRSHPWDNNSQPSTPYSPMLEDSGEVPGGGGEPSTSSAASKDSAKLRNLLTNSARPSHPQQQQSPSSRHRILKGLLNQEDEDDELDASTESAKDVASSTNTRPASNSSSSSAAPLAPSTTSNNHMLLKLLNDKSEDDDVEARAGLKRPNELLQQLLKEDECGERAGGAASAQEDSLLKSLGFSGASPPGTSSPHPGGGGAECGAAVGSAGRKRPSLESDDGAGGKRLQQHTPLNHSPVQPMSIPTAPTSTPSQVSSSGNSSRLWEKNKMLASLLAKQPPQAQTIPPIPTSLLQAQPNVRLPKVMDGAAPLQQQKAAVAPQQPAAQQQQQQAPLEATAGPSSGRMEAADSSSVMVNSSTRGWDSVSSANDEMLSDILDQVIEFVPENQMPDGNNYIDPMEPTMMMSGGGAGGNMIAVSGGANAGPQGSANEGLSEKMAISAIQKSLMLCEKAVKSPPHYPTPMPPPPMYPTPAQQRAALGFSQPSPMQQPGMQNAAAAAVRAQFAAQATVQAAAAASGQQQQQMSLQQRRKMMNQQQQMHKQRLLQQQRQQQVVINNAAAQVKQQDPHSSMEGIMPPNVTLQRSASVPDSQLSPGYKPLSPSQQQQQQQRQPQQQQQFNSFNAGNFGGQQVTRLSPLSGATNALPPFQQQQQLSPRVNQGMQQQQQWTGQDSVGNRLSVQQQQNPMLNAQLTSAYPQQQQQQQQQGAPRMAAYSQVQRVHSGGGARSSPFAPDNAPPSSPGAGGVSSFQAAAFGGGGGGGGGPAASNFSPQLQQMQLQLQQQHQMRLQRALSHPAAAGAPSNGPHPQQMQNVAGWHQQELMGCAPMASASAVLKHHHQHQHLYQTPQSPLPYPTSEHISSYDHPSLQQQYPFSPLPHRTTQLSPGANNGMPSEFVLQKLRATVSASNQQHQPQPMQSGAMVSSPRLQQPPPQQQQQQMVQLGASSNLISNEDLQALGIIEIDNGNKTWDIASNAGQQQQMGPGPSSVREDAGMRGGGAASQSSLLQKLLSE